MRIINLAIKDLSQIFRDKRSLIFLVAMPIAFTLFMGFAYQGGESTADQSDPRIPLAWVENEPKGELGTLLYARLDQSDALIPVRMEKDAALDALQKGEVDGVLVIPSGFGEQSGEKPLAQIKLLTDSTSTKGQVLYQVLRVPVSQLMSAVEIGQMGVDAMNNPGEFAPTLELAWEKWKQNNTGKSIQMEQAVAQESESWFGDNPYNQASPGILVQFAIMGLVTSAQILVQERKSRTLQRLMTTAMKPWEVLMGHMLGMFAIVYLQIALLVVFGQWILDVNYLSEPLSTFLITVAMGLWISSMGLLIGLAAKGDDQVVLYSMVAMFFFSGLGGTWFPLEAAGNVFSTIGKALPSAWAMIGLQNILIRGLGILSVWQPVGNLSAYALGFFILAVWRFRRLEI